MQPDDTLNDDALDRELERALAVDPSPEFAARVRTRIANEPARSPWRASWMFALGAAAVSVVAVIVVQLNRGAASVADTPLLAARTIAPYVASGFSRTSPEPYRSAEAVALQSKRSAKAFALQPNDSEILIDPRESMALRGFINGVRGGRVDLRPVLSASVPTAMDLPPIDDIVISPITIEPLAPPTGAEGVRQ
jgi:hypothetical protein